jgi:hypothetical protein
LSAPSSRPSNKATGTNISCASRSADSRRVVAGLVADIWGPAAGGLFLAFPAIFCASATLIEKHERERKEKKGLQGKERGKDAAALDAAGAGLGGIALAVFGAVIWFLASDTAAGSLALATIAWLVVAILLWRVRRTMRVLQNVRHGTSSLSAGSYAGSGTTRL